MNMFTDQKPDKEQSEQFKKEICEMIDSGNASFIIMGDWHADPKGKSLCIMAGDKNQIINGVVHVYRRLPEGNLKQKVKEALEEAAMISTIALTIINTLEN